MTMTPQKPIRVFYSVLSDRFYASQKYHEERRGDKLHYTITGKKYDVTQDIGEAIVTHGITFDDVDEHEEATDDAGTSNHAGTTESLRTDDPDDQAAHEAAMFAYTVDIADMIAQTMIIPIDDPVTEQLAEAIAALPTPVKGGGG